MKKIFNVLSVLLISIGLLGGSQASAQEFSADMVNRVGKQTMTGKIYVSHDKVRMDMAESIMIIRSDKKITYMVMPSQKMYMEHPIDLSKAPKVAKALVGEIERVSLGKENVNGYDTEKFKVTYKENKKEISVYQWIKDGQFPIKVEAVDGSFSTEYKNLKVGSPSADLFEPPSGYTKMEMPNVKSLMGGFLK